ncbi:MAG TPA: 2Fe-2S iron-sulfur cluster-binding protein [Pyrinomonadaceae bacterium]|jgi:ferredoxin|nr:2Fe-2S iron-sulfur cluster-binding protein [Pyrinomonadaceae bacterium]
MTAFETHLEKQTEKQWWSALEGLLPDIHEVDRNAVQIWFRFYPLALFDFLQASEDQEKARKKFVMQGTYDLKDQIDSSHKFFYGHTYWKQVKDAISARADSFTGDSFDLASEIRSAAGAAAVTTGANVSVLLGITAAGLMTLRQVGAEAFKAAPGQIVTSRAHLKKSPEQILAARAKDDSQGLFGFLRTVDKQWSVNYDETDPSARFKLMNEEEIASAAAKDQSKNWIEIDPRRPEGPIPVECRSASCGTCWVGVLGGSEKLSDVSEREKKQLKVFGYSSSEDKKPLIRLACQAKATGAVSVVIPPWNGVFGKKVYGNVEDVELEPNTTTAKNNRGIVRDTVKNKLM